MSKSRINVIDQEAQIKALEQQLAEAKVRIEALSAGGAGPGSAGETLNEESALASILESLPAGVFITDAEGRFTAANTTALALLRGRLNGTARGPNDGYTLHRPDGSPYPGDELPLVKAFQRGVASRNVELLVRFDDGGETLLLVDAAPLYDPDFQISGALALMRDITEYERSTLAQKHALQEITAQHSFLNAVLDHLPLGVMISEAPSSRSLYHNREAERLLGHPPIEGDHYSRFKRYKAVRPDGTPYTPEEYPTVRAVLYGETVREEEVHYRSKDREEKLFSVSATPIVDGAGKRIAAVTTFYEITGQKRLEKALRKSEEELRLVLSSITEAYISFDDAWRLVDINTSAANTFFPKQKASSLLGKVLWQEFPKAVGSDVVHYLNLVRETGKPVHFDTHSRSRNTWYEVHAFPRHKRVDVYLHDITPRKRAEQALRDSEARLSLAIESSGVVVFTQDRDLRYTWIRDPNTGFLGSEVIGKTDKDLLPPEDARRLAAVKNRVLETGEKVRVEVRSTIEDTAYYYDLTIEPTYDEDQQISGILCSSYDITYRKKVEEILRQINEELKRKVAERTRELEDANLELQRKIEERARIEADLVEMRQRLMDSVEAERRQIARELHDGPMQDIYAMNYSLALMEGEDIPPEISREIQEHRTQLNQVNQALRTISHNLLPPTLESFGVSKSIQEHAENLRRAKPGLEIELDLTPFQTALSNPVRLALFRIYQTVVGNILRHSQATRVSIRLTRSDGHVLLEITDNGIGFHVPQRWIEFARQGHLGLAGAHERAENIGGRLEVKSEPGRGTVVRVFVPLEKTEL